MEFLLPRLVGAFIVGYLIVSVSMWFAQRRRTKEENRKRKEHHDRHREWLRKRDAHRLSPWHIEEIKAKLDELKNL